MTFDRVNRRTHLYLGILLTPWFVIYALSSVILNHGAWFQTKADGTPDWTPRFEHAYRLPPELSGAGSYEQAMRILRDCGLEGRFRAGTNAEGNLVIDRRRFLTTIRLTYNPEKGRLAAEDKRFHWQQALTAMHFRAGFVQPYFIESLWAVMVDLLAVATLVWIASGLYIWLKLGRLRFWGWVSLAAGCISFLAIAFRL